MDTINNFFKNYEGLVIFLNLSIAALLFAYKGVNRFKKFQASLRKASENLTSELEYLANQGTSFNKRMEIYTYVDSRISKFRHFVLCFTVITSVYCALSIIGFFYVVELLKEEYQVVKLSDAIPFAPLSDLIFSTLTLLGILLIPAILIFLLRKVNEITESMGDAYLSVLNKQIGSRYDKKQCE